MNYNSYIFWYFVQFVNICVGVILMTTNIPNYNMRKLLFIFFTVFAIHKFKSQTTSWNDLKKYIGTYSKQTDFFRNPLIKNELKKILGEDYKSYQSFVSSAGCGEVEFKYGLIYGDVSQESVGGYNSLFFINIKSEKIYLFWLTERVWDKKYKIYGDKPTPANVLNLITEDMNIGWGHVATFKAEGDSINIHLNNEK